MAGREGGQGEREGGGGRLRGSVERNGPNCATTDLTESVYSLGHIRFCAHDEPERGVKVNPWPWTGPPGPPVLRRTDDSKYVPYSRYRCLLRCLSSPGSCLGRLCPRKRLIHKGQLHSKGSSSRQQPLHSCRAGTGDTTKT